jgi:hypothetical protein
VYGTLISTYLLTAGLKLAAWPKRDFLEVFGSRKGPADCCIERNDLRAPVERPKILHLFDQGRKQLSEMACALHEGMIPPSIVTLTPAVNEPINIEVPFLRETVSLHPILMSPARSWGRRICANLSSAF